MTLDSARTPHVPLDAARMRGFLAPLREDTDAVRAMLGGTQDELARRLFVMQAFKAAAHMLKKAVMHALEKADYEHNLDEDDWMAAAGDA